MRRTKRRPERLLGMTQNNISDSGALRWIVILGSIALVIAGGIVLYAMAHTGASAVEQVTGGAEPDAFPELPAFPDRETADRTEGTEADNKEASQPESSSATPAAREMEQMDQQQQLQQQRQEFEAEKAAAPYEKEIDRLDAQQQLMDKQEEVDQQRREAVPSLLPENPPAPVTDFTPNVR